MKSSKIIIAAVLSLVATTAFARGGHGRRGHGGPGPNPIVAHAMLKDAGLSDAQIAKIDKLHDAAQRKMIDIRHDLQLARLDMRQLMSSYKVDRSKVLAQLDKIDAMKLKLKKLHVGLRLDIRAVMTEQQWEKVKLMHAKMRAGRRGMGKAGRGGFGRGMGAGGPGNPMGPDF